MNEIEAIRELIKICDKLLAPGGCPWDIKQTMMTARKYVLEEVCELIEAIDLEDNAHIEEELGDLFYNAIFLSRLAEKEGRSSLKGVVKGITEKLIRRHPHVFGESDVDSIDEVIHQWERIKKEEKGKSLRKSLLDGIPKTLPTLTRAVKVIKALRKGGTPLSVQEPPEFSDESSLGSLLWSIAVKAQEKGIDPEHALRKVISENIDSQQKP